MFILINGVQGNALQFGKEVLIAASPKDVKVNQSLQKLSAVIIITLVCQLQAYSRAIYIRISNTLAVFKVTSLLFIVMCGIVALRNGRVPEAKDEFSTPYGKEDLVNAFASASNNPYQYGIALLNVMRAFLGYENANFVLLCFSYQGCLLINFQVLNEVRAGPEGDERRTFRRAVKSSVFITCFLYIMVNVAFVSLELAGNHLAFIIFVNFKSQFAVCTKEEIINMPETLPFFLEKVITTILLNCLKSSKFNIT
jgi:amino acid transporter